MRSLSFYSFLELMSLIGTLMFSQSLMAFPETARHGYLSCVTCHLSPSGRGILTSYGKTLSHELYSYKKIDNGNESLEAEVPWWQVGGRTRLMQYILDTPEMQKGHFFPMQMELEASIEKGIWALGLSAGGWRPMAGPKEKLKGYLRNAYVLWRPTEAWNFRAGKFRISHGLGLPDHATLVNEKMGWSHSHETQNIEVTRLSESTIIQASWVLPSYLLVSEEMFSGISLGVEQLLNLKHRVGLNLSRFHRANVNESHLNLHTVININEKSFLQAELAQRRMEYARPTDEYAFLMRYSHEFQYGLRPLIQWEEFLSKSVTVSAPQQERRFYLGTEWFPVLHTDFLFLIGNQMDSSFDDARIVMIIGHFYF